MNVKLIKVVLLVFMAFLVGCEDSSSPPTPPPTTYPSFSPVTYPATGSNTTVIFMHGKTGNPYAGFLYSLYTTLTSAGYTVIAPYMPWTGFVWYGTLDQAMAYISSLVDTEKAAGKKVVLIGHSMGGAAALIYNSRTDVTAVDATVAIAPGHFFSDSTSLQQAAATSTATAQAMVTAGNGETYGSFQTSNLGVQQTISATANTYLSYHDVNQYPSMINDVLPQISQPLYWIGGDADSLTVNYPNLFPIVPANANSKLETLSGDHYTIVANSAGSIVAWLTSMGL